MHFIHTQKNKNEWNSIYLANHELNRYPSEVLISWAYNNKSMLQGKCLDIGCGYGNNLRFLKDINLDVYGIDISEVVIDLIKEEFDSFVSCQSIKSTSFKDCFFDVLVDRQSIQHNDKNDLDAIMQECSRILKPNGIFFMNFLLSQGNGTSLAKITEKNLIEIISKHFTIAEKNYFCITTENANIEHKTIILTLFKKNAD